MRAQIRSIAKKYNLLQYYQLYKGTHEGKAHKQQFNMDIAAFKESAEHSTARFDHKTMELWPIMNDKTTTTMFEPHYIYHPAWAARVVAKINPAKHVDISSTLHFCTIVSAFLPVEFYDYRPAQLNLTNLISKKGDLLDLPFKDNTIESISCMHTLEHVGLGRYGDPIDYDGDLKAMDELKRVVAPGGNLIVVVPLGKKRIVYNAHRIYSYEQILSYFAPLQLVEFSLVPDDYEKNGLIINASKEVADQQDWGCGCFWFKKQ